MEEANVTIASGCEEFGWWYPRGPVDNQNKPTMFNLAGFPLSLPSILIYSYSQVASLLSQ